MWQGGLVTILCYRGCQWLVEVRVKMEMCTYVINLFIIQQIWL